MKTDKELLQLAAKVAGISGEYIEPSKFKGDVHGWHVGNGGFWNPLLDDGDALRLAVDLDMTITQLQYSAECVYYIDGDAFDPIHERHAADKHAATRRAIVLAAAAIGEAM